MRGLAVLLADNRERLVEQLPYRRRAGLTSAAQLPVANDRAAQAGDRNPGYDLGLELLS